MVFDIILIAILCFALFRGRRKGLILSASRFVSLIFSGVATSVFAGRLEEWMTGTAWYNRQCEKLASMISKVTEAEGTALIETVVGETDKIAQSAAQNIVAALLTGICFIVFCIFFNVLLNFASKLLMHIPIAGSVNRILGMVFSLVFTVVLIYIVVGAFGGFATFSSSEIIRQQMENSYIVRFVYNNNFIEYLL